MSVAIIAAKTSTLIAQVFLGYLFSAGEFGKFALIVGTMSLTSGFIDTGINKFLIKEQDKLPENMRPAIIFTLLAAIAGGAILVTATYAQTLDTETVAAACIIALFLPLNSAAQIYKARLSINLSLPVISRVEIYASIANTAVLIGCAFFGLGVTSYGLAFAASYSTTFILLRHATKSRCPKITFTEKTTTIIELAYQLRWIALTTFAMGIALRGDFLVLSKFLSESDLGIYYFAFMLTANLGLVIAHGINNVFMPFLVKENKNNHARAMLFTKHSSIIFSGTSIISLTFILLGPSAVHLIWDGKWDTAALLASFFAVSLPLKMLAPMSYSLLEAKGLWKRKFSYISLDAVTVLGSVTIGAYNFGLEGAVVLLSIQRAAIGVFIYISSSKACNVSKRRTREMLIKLTLPAISILSLALAIAQLIPYKFDSIFYQATVSFTAFLTFTLLLAGIPNLRKSLPLQKIGLRA
ncbi:oligosaccharide flippase family protein [Halopseudomonas sabulinigri]|nr:oligosaccharide flippase family protein [Halopseudomonas sabulinigri]